MTNEKGDTLPETVSRDAKEERDIVETLRDFYSYPDGADGVMALGGRAADVIEHLRGESAKELERANHYRESWQESTALLRAAERKLHSLGYLRCTVPACNCNSYHKSETCADCGGQGWYVVHTGHNGEIPEQAQCPNCGGIGLV